MHKVNLLKSNLNCPNIKSLQRAASTIEVESGDSRPNVSGECVAICSLTVQFVGRESWPTIVGLVAV